MHVAPLIFIYTPTAPPAKPLQLPLTAYLISLDALGSCLTSGILLACEVVLIVNISPTVPNWISCGI